MAFTWNYGYGTTITSSVVHFNRSQMDYHADGTPLSVDEKSVVAVHEFGHSMGRWHNPTFGCDLNVAGLMYPSPLQKSNLCGWTVPSYDDKAGVHAIYG